MHKLFGNEEKQAECDKNIAHVLEYREYDEQKFAREKEKAALVTQGLYSINLSNLSMNWEE